MRMNAIPRFGWMISVASIALSASAQTVDGTPHLRKQGAATQLIVDGKPFLALGGELTNNAATSLPMMDPIWPKIVAADLNTVLVGLAWGQFEPEEGTFDYTQVDGVIAGARENHMHIVFLCRFNVSHLLYPANYLVVTARPNCRKMGLLRNG